MDEFFQLIERFLDDQSVAAENSRKLYRRVLYIFLRWLDNKAINIYEAKKIDILAFKNSLNQLSDLTIVNYLIIIRLFFRWAEENDILKDITRGIKIRRKYSGFKKEPLNNQQASRLLEVIPKEKITGLRDYALLNLLLRTGIRLIEASRINIGDMQNLSGEVIIYLQRKGRHDKDQITVLSGKTYEAIESYLIQRGDFKDSDPLFIVHGPNNRGHRLSSPAMSHIVKTYLRAIGLDSKRYSAHSLRHTAGYNAIVNHASEYLTQLYMGHSSFSTTQIYTRMAEREMLLKNSPSKITDEMF